MNPKTGYTLLMEYFNMTYNRKNSGWHSGNEYYFVADARKNDYINMQKMLMHGCDVNFKA